MAFQLSDRAKELIPKARIVSFAGWSGQYPPELIARFQAADDAGRYLEDADLEAIAAQNGNTTAIQTAQQLRDTANDLVSQAREQVLQQFPGIAESGGKLYPPARAEACWRDFWHFLRCVTYGIATGQAEFTSPEGLHYMNLLYQELKVPLAAMIYGLNALKQVSIEQYGELAMAPCFNHLIEKLEQFEP
ncbi:MAG: phycobilisome protein [Spirulina sp. SIO3F2]|nr:phycobilisome protein [Spirulina sp. SIO3F2]